MSHEFSSAEIERFLSDLLNMSRGTQDEVSVKLMYGTVLPDNDPSLWQQLLRQIWTETPATKEWIAFLIRLKLHKNAFDYVSSLEQGTIPHEPARTHFEEAVTYLLKTSHRTRKCGNPECERPYFFLTRRNQKYCSDECARPSQLAAKRDWWDQHGDVWRNKRNKQNVNLKSN